MFKKDIEIKKLVKITETYNDLSGYKVNHDLLTKINYVNIDVTINYHDSIKTIDLKGNLAYSFDAIDARTGLEIKGNEDKLYWENSFSFEENDASGDNNIVLGDEFNVLDYAIDEIVLNIPINFSKNYDKISIVNEYGEVFDEDDYTGHRNNEIDPRWEKLKQFKFNEDK